MKMRKFVRLNLDNLAELPESVQSCVFWELDPVARARAEQAGLAAAEKEAWLSQVLLDWGSCGRVAVVDGEVAGFISYAPPAYFPGASSLPSAPAADDAVLLATAMVLPEYAGGGLGRALVQALAKDLLKRGGIRAVEAFGATKPNGPAGGCVLPVDFLLRVGFKTQRPHPVYPRLRLELRSVLTWREEVELALERLVGVVRPPVPASRRLGRIADPPTPQGPPAE